jgi:hypothetical protein
MLHTSNIPNRFTLTLFPFYTFSGSQIWPAFHPLHRTQSGKTCILRPGTTEIKHPVWSKTANSWNPLAECSSIAPLTLAGNNLLKIEADSDASVDKYIKKLRILSNCL